MKNNKYYTELLRYAFKVAFNSDEAEDLLQTVLLSAIEKGRADMTCSINRRWLIGALRNQSAFYARSAVRRRNRESSITYINQLPSESSVSTTQFVNTLPPGLKTTTLLALTGHTKAEISWLLRVSDSALRQRIVQIKRRWRQFDGGSVLELKGLKEGLAYGRIRKALLQVPCRDQKTLASHDPDGHLFMVSSQKGTSRQHRVKSIQIEEVNNA